MFHPHKSFLCTVPMTVIVGKHVSWSDLFFSFYVNLIDLNSYRRKQERRFLVIDKLQMILVEPDTRRLGWGVVRFVGYLQVSVHNSTPTAKNSKLPIKRGTKYPRACL